MTHRPQRDPQTTLRREPSQERSRALVESIVEATARVLKAEGLLGLTTNRAAQVAGVSIGSLYQYFPSKEALLARLIERELEEDLSQLRGALALASAQDQPIEATLRELVQRGVHRACQTRALHQVLLPQVAPLERERLVSQSVQGAAHEVAAWLWPQRDALGPPWPSLGRDAFERRALLTLRAAEAILNTAKVERPALLDDPEQVIHDMMTVLLGLLGLTPQTR